MHRARCSASSSSTRADPTEALPGRPSCRQGFQRCTAVADELLKRGFDGDFDRMIAWWRLEKQRFAQAETEAAIRR